jgi:dynein heavy chain
MGIFEAHKLIFSFQMTTMIMDGDSTLDRKELDFFLKGNTSLDEVERNPIKWLSDASWKDCVKLDSNKGAFEGLLESVKD